MVVAVLASLLLSIDAASNSQTVSSTESISISNSVSNTLSITTSGTVTYSPSFTTSGTITATDSPSFGFTLTNTVSNSLSLTTSITTSTSFSISISNTFTASCTNPVLQDRCATQQTVICPFYTLRAGICPPPASSTGTSTFLYIITNSTGGVYTKNVTFPAGVTPQFPSSSISTNGFLHNGATYMFQVFQINTDGSRGLASNQLVKTLVSDTRDPSAKCAFEACNQFCGTQLGQFLCSWTLGNATLKRIVLEILACYDSSTFLPVSVPAVSHRRLGGAANKKSTGISLQCQSRTLCFVKLTLRYPRFYKALYNLQRVQQVSKFGVICA